MTVANPLMVAGATGYGVWPDNSLEGALGVFSSTVSGPDWASYAIDLVTRPV